jgi:hypothetical protein
MPTLEEIGICEKFTYLTTPTTKSVWCYIL